MTFPGTLKVKFLFLPLLLWLAFGNPDAVCGQKQLPLGEKFQNPSGIRNFRTRKNNVLKGTDPLSQYGNDMLAYYRQYLLPALTRSDQRENWDDLHKEVVSDLMNATDSKARLEVLKVVWKSCNLIVPDPQYHPSTRYNFLLLLGDLNQKEASGSTPPVPLSKYALPKLMEAFEKENYPYSLRYAAILGIVRHAELTGHPKSAAPLNAADKQKLAELLVKVATDTKVPEDVEPAAHNWLRAKSIEALGDLYLNSEEVVTTLANLLVDETADLDVRCEAATAIGKIGDQIDVNRIDDLVGRLAKLAQDCIQTELDTLVAQNKGRGNRMEMRDQPPRRWEGQDGGTDSTDRNKLEISDERTTPTRRRLLFRLLAVQNAVAGDNQGIAGLAKLAAAADQIAPLKTELAKLIDALQDVTSQFEKLGAIIKLAADEELPAMVPDNLKRPERKGRQGSRQPQDDVAAAGQP